MGMPYRNKRVVHHGNDTYGVSLPKEWLLYWAEFNDGNRLETVDMQVNEDFIVIRPPRPLVQKRDEVEPKYKEPSLRRR